MLFDVLQPNLSGCKIINFVLKSFKTKFFSNKNICYRFDFCFNVNHWCCLTLYSTTFQVALHFGRFKNKTIFDQKHKLCVWFLLERQPLMLFDVIQLNLLGCKIKTLFCKVLKRNVFRTKTFVIGLIFALTSTIDAVRRYTAQPFRLEDN